jgi:hypothetical protein
MISIKKTAVVDRIPVCSARVTCDVPEYQMVIPHGKISPNHLNLIRGRKH